MRYLLSALLLMASCMQALALDWQKSTEVENIFRTAGVKGTFVLYDVSNKKLIGYNHKRAETRYIPASTFKIPNSLIGLSVGAVKSVDEILPYGGNPQPMKAWEKDMSLRDAIKVSSLPIYQELARRIGLKRMRAEIAMLGYGNHEIGKVVDYFWLRGPLKISAVEQARFLARLALNQLPYSEEVQSKVREITLIEQSDKWKLFAKTGHAVHVIPNIGWWVGWVEKSGHIYTFALNIDIYQQDDLIKRRELGVASLIILGILE